jgi:hypothetical protein
MFVSDDPDRFMWRRRPAGDFFRISTHRKNAGETPAPQNKASKTQIVACPAYSKFLMVFEN